ncbi:MAG: hypothetical protein ACREDM_07320 [Methylocella sp.]
MTIAKSISIVNDGVGTAGITASSGNGVTINAGASDSVHLRGLTIEGLHAPVSNGIKFKTGGNLAIENCVIRDFQNGIDISPTTSSSFSVSNTIASNNGADGIFVGPRGSAVVAGVLSEVTATNNGDGIFVSGAGTTGASLNVTIVDSVVSNNPDFGVLSNSITGGHAVTAVLVRTSVASNNGTGLFASNATLRVAHSVVTGNNIGVSTPVGGLCCSYGDNDIDGNTNNNTGILITNPTH